MPELKQGGAPGGIGGPPGGRGGGGGGGQQAKGRGGGGGGRSLVVVEEDRVSGPPGGGGEDTGPTCGKTKTGRMVCPSALKLIESPHYPHFLLTEPSSTLHVYLDTNFLSVF